MNIKISQVFLLLVCLSACSERAWKKIAYDSMRMNPKCLNDMHCQSTQSQTSYDEYEREYQQRQRQVRVKSVEQAQNKK